MNVAIIAACVAAQTPNPKYLKIMNYTYLVRPFTPQILLLTKAISRRLPSLLSPLSNAFHPPENSSHKTRHRGALLRPLISVYPDLLQPTRRLEVTERIMNNLPTLESLDLILRERTISSRAMREEGWFGWCRARWMMMRG